MITLCLAWIDAHYKTSFLGGGFEAITILVDAVTVITTLCVIGHFLTLTSC